MEGENGASPPSRATLIVVIGVVRSRNVGTLEMARPFNGAGHFRSADANPSRITLRNGTQPSELSIR